jgi:uncharacterized membrane protein
VYLLVNDQFYVGVYFRVLNLHVFYVVVSFVLTASYILSALVGLCDDCKDITFHITYPRIRSYKSEESQMA